MPELLKAPPLPDVLAPETVTPEINKLPPVAMLKILKLRRATPLSPLIVRVEELGPVMVRVPALAAVTIVGSAEASVMVPVTPALKVIVSAPVSEALASNIACLREPTPKSLLFVTVKVAGVILSSRPMSSSRLKRVLGLALGLLFLRLKSLLKNELIVKYLYRRNSELCFAMALFKKPFATKSNNTQKRNLTNGFTIKKAIFKREKALMIKTLILCIDINRPMP